MTDAVTELLLSFELTATCVNVWMLEDFSAWRIQRVYCARQLCAIDSEVLQILRHVLISARNCCLRVCTCALQFGSLKRLDISEHSSLGGSVGQAAVQRAESVAFRKQQLSWIAPAAAAPPPAFWPTEAAGVWKEHEGDEERRGTGGTASSSDNGNGVPRWAGLHVHGKIVSACHSSLSLRKYVV